MNLPSVEMLFVLAIFFALVVLASLISWIIWRRSRIKQLEIMLQSKNNHDLFEIANDYSENPSWLAIAAERVLRRRLSTPP